MEDFKKKKEELVEEFNRNQQMINQLSARQQQIIGVLNFIEELEKKEKEVKDKNKVK
jgi:mannose/fructose/N-acetylgalactosamine-specific phosphotransferase system component IID